MTKKSLSISWPWNLHCNREVTHNEEIEKLTKENTMTETPCLWIIAHNWNVFKNDSFWTTAHKTENHRHAKINSSRCGGAGLLSYHLGS